MNLYSSPISLDLRQFTEQSSKHGTLDSIIHNCFDSTAMYVPLAIALFISYILDNWVQGKIEDEG